MKISLKAIIIASILIHLTLFSIAQNRFEIIVKDSATSETLVGVNVYLKGTTNGSVTDVQGYALLTNLPDGNQTIIVSYVGYKKAELSYLFPFQNSSKPVIILLPAEQEQMEEVTISATRTNSRIEDLPTKIEILGQDDLEEENGIKPGNIASILGDIAGIQMQQTSSASGSLNARIQGLNGRYSQILRDGMPLYGGFSGSFSLLQIPPLDLKQIEIIKGSSSTLFGGDAIGGIINLVSKTPEDKPATSFLINQTTLKETDVNTFISRKYKHLGFTFFGGYVFQKAVDVNKDGFSDVPDINNLIIHPKLFYYPDRKTIVSIGYTGGFEKRKGGDIQVISNAPDQQHQYFVDHQSKRNTVELGCQRKDASGSQLSFKGSTSFLNRTIENQRYLFGANQNLFYSELSYLLKKEKYDFVFGANFNGDIFDKKQADSFNIPDYTYTTIGAFVQNDWRITKQLLLETGLRYDYHSRYNGFILPQASVLYKIIPQLTARLNGGWGYKIPVTFSYVDEETDLDRIQTSQFDLNPETSKGVNFDINYTTTFWGKLSFTFNQSFYYTLLDHPVDTLKNSMVNMFNASKPVETKGLQSYIRLAYGSFEFYLSYVYTHAIKKYNEANPWFLATPSHNAATTLTYEPSERFRVGIEGSYIGQQYIENNEKTPGYIFLAAMIQYNYRKISIVLNCENLLDYRQSDYLIPPLTSPEFKTLWAPVDGRVFNLSLNLKL